MLLADALWRELLLRIASELASSTADDVAAHYAADAAQIVNDQKITEPEAVIRATIQMVEDKQGWRKRAVRAALVIAGTTRAKVRDRFAEATLARVKEKSLSDPAKIAAETIAVIREKQGWDAVAQRPT